MTQFHGVPAAKTAWVTGQEVKVKVYVNAGFGPAKWRKAAKIDGRATSQFEKPTRYYVAFDDGSRGVFDEDHIRSATLK